jgi:DNA transposition AAA+ family ATPase
MTAELNRLSLIEQAQFSTEKPAEIRGKLKGLIESGEIRLREIGKFTGFSPSTISTVINNTYEGDVEKLEDALARFYRNWLARNAIVETNVVREIYSTMELAWKRKEIARIVAPFGRGKTKAGSRYVMLNSEFAVYVELTITTSPTSLLHRIADSLNIDMAGSQDDKLFSIIRSLQRKPRLLVIDEADNLKPRTLAILQAVHGGEAAERCAIVLMGTERLKKILNDPILGYLKRRIRIKRDFGDVSFDEAKKIADMWIHSLDRDELKEAWSWSLKQFGVASLVALMARSYDAMQMTKKRKIDSECLEAGYSWLID